MICGSGGSKSRLAKAAGAEPAGQRSDEQLHAVVARSTFPSENVQNTPFSDHFWKLRCQKSARRCGAKRISKSKVLKTGGLGPLLEVAMSKKCTFPSQNVQNTTCSRHFWRFGCWKSARRCGAKHISKWKCTNTRGSDHFWRFRCRFAASLHYTTLRYITPHSTIRHYITLHYTPQHYNYNYTTRLHPTTLHYSKFHYTTLHYTTLHYTTLH